MKKFLSILKRNWMWPLMFLASDGFFAYLLWVADFEALIKLSTILVLFTVIGLTLIFLYLLHRYNKDSANLDAFLDEPTSARQAFLGDDKNIVRLGNKLRADGNEIRSLKERIDDYEEYVEAWAHETKIPVSLLSLVLDNHKDALPPDIAYKLEHVRTSVSDSVDKMMQYSRIKSGRKDYLSEKIKIKSAIENVLEEYRPLLDEKDFLVINSVHDETCFMDKRALKYMLSQFIGNSIKYCSDAPELSFAIENGALLIRDNGIGVKSCDLPFIFERGFTGETGDYRTKATGMGLYLASKLAEDMKCTLTAESEGEGKGLTIKLGYPEVELI